MHFETITSTKKIKKEVDKRKQRRQKVKIKKELKLNGNEIAK